MPVYTIEVKPSKGGQWYWVLKARNGKVLATSERYKRKPRKLVEGIADDFNRGYPGMCVVKGLED